ncbi:hypothetical protein SUGI_0935540 [Cryptomeria japonica]|nr:hypothetical protein SUGI_0935540 [Cryptomeria japonica]
MNRSSWAIFFLFFFAFFISLPSTPGARKLVNEGWNNNEMAAVAALGRRSPWVPPSPTRGVNQPYDHPVSPPPAISI